VGVPKGCVSNVSRTSPHQELPRSALSDNFRERLCDRFARPLDPLLDRQPDRRHFRISADRLCGFAPGAVKKGIRRGYAGVRGVALPHFREQALDRLGRVSSGEFSDFGNTAWTAAGIAGSAGRPSSVQRRGIT
jgi:hypothetical protein